MNEVLKGIERECEAIMDGCYGEDTAYEQISVLANCVKGLAVAMQLLNQNKQER